MRQRINDEERRQWVLNDEGLYNEQQRSGLSMRAFIKQHRVFIDEIIENVVSGRKPAHYLVYDRGPRRNPSKRRLLRDLPSRQREVTINNTVVASWHERDRDYIELMWKDTEETILEAWDEDYRGLVEDGFIDPRPRRLHLSLIEYARHMGLAR